MKIIELFNRKLNQSNLLDESSKNTFQNNNQRFLKSVVDKLPKHQKVAVIGAGKMTDFSVEYLAKRFDEVVLTDIDLLSVNEAIKYEKLPKHLLEKITKIRVEYTGFEQNQFFNDFKERIVNCHSYDKLEKVVKSKLTGLEEYKFLKDYQNSIDLLYVSPIYTQLVYNQLLRECAILRENRYPEHLIKYLEEILLDEMVYVIDRFNQNLVQSLSDEGVMYVLSDIFQIDNGSEFYYRIINGIQSHDVMEEIYLGYQRKYGVGLGDYGLINLDDKLHSTLSKWLLWEFDNEKMFVVKLKVYKKNNNKEEEIK